MIIDFINIDEGRAKELEYFEGYLPNVILSYIDATAYLRFVKKLDNNEEILKRLQKAHFFSFEEHVRDFKKWLKDNPKYADIIKK